MCVATVHTGAQQTPLANPAPPFCSARHQFSVRLITKFRSQITTAPWHTVHVTRATFWTETFLSSIAILRHCATNWFQPLSVGSSAGGSGQASG